MEVIGRIKKIGPVNEYGANGFKKRELVLVTEEQYPQFILVEFTQDRCTLLDPLQEGQQVKVSFNLRGREWINPQGEAKYFNSLNGWKVESIQADTPPPMAPPDNLEEIEPVNDIEPDDLPF
jgi:hypothetical protein